MRIEHMVNTEDPTDVDMEREDLGQMTSTFLRVSLLKKWLSLSISMYNKSKSENGFLPRYYKLMLKLHLKILLHI